MNIFNRITLQAIRKSRTRTIVTIIGVILSAAMVTAIATFGISLLTYMTKGAAEKYGKWHVAFFDADPAFVEEQAANSDVADIVTFENIGYAVLPDSEALEKPYLFIAGFSQEAFNTLPVTLLSGRMPANSGEILISGKLASKDGGKYAIGDTLSLSTGRRLRQGQQLTQTDAYSSADEVFVSGEDKTYTIVGIIQTPSFEEDSAPGYTLITVSEDTAAADDLSAFVTLVNPRKVHTYARSMAGGKNYTANNYVLRFMGLSNDAGGKIFTALLLSVGVIVIIIVMIGSVFLIYNSFNISVNERTQQFGILASVGASEKQLRNSVLFEGLCIGTVGIPVGIMVGLASVQLVISIVARNFGNVVYANVPLALELSPVAIVGAVLVSLITILISAYIPAKKVARTPVMECIRQTNAIKTGPKSVRTGRLSSRLFGLEGTLALKNFKRNKRRYRSIVLSLVLSIVLFVSTSAFVTSLNQLGEAAKSVTDYDIGFGSEDMEDSELLRLYGQLKTADGVSQSTCQSIAQFTCSVQASQLSDAYWNSSDVSKADDTIDLPVQIQFLDDSSYLKIIDDLGLPAVEYMGDAAKMLTVAKMTNNHQTAAVSQLSDLFTSLSLDVTLTPQTDDEANEKRMQSVNLTCIDIVPPDIPPVSGAVEQQSYFFQIIVPYSLIESVIPSDLEVDMRVKGLTFQSDTPTLSVNSMKEIIQESDVKGSYLLINTSEVFDESRNYTFIANVFAYTFIIMISLIAIANVFNTISTNIRLRRRELAMVRSVGMSDRSFNKMMRLECAFYGIRALLVGLPLSMLLSWLIYKGLETGGADSINFELPWLSIGISVFSVLLIIFVTMMYAVSKLKKENIIDALRDDMT